MQVADSRGAGKVCACVHNIHPQGWCERAGEWRFRLQKLPRQGTARVRTIDNRAAPLRNGVHHSRARVQPSSTAGTTTTVSPQATEGGGADHRDANTPTHDHKQIGALHTKVNKSSNSSEPGYNTTSREKVWKQRTAGVQHQRRTEWRVQTAKAVQ